VHAWLQVVEAMGRQRPKSDGKCFNRSPICIIIIVVFISLAVFMIYGAYALFEYSNALDLWRVQGRSEVVTSPATVALNASAAKYLHAVGPSFRFDGRVVSCGSRPFSTRPHVLAHFPHEILSRRVCAAAAQRAETRPDRRRHRHRIMRFWNAGSLASIGARCCGCACCRS
jgi:hypothetical protein